jgi:hypothetical protein
MEVVGGSRALQRGAASSVRGACAQMLTEALNLSRRSCGGDACHTTVTLAASRVSGVKEQSSVNRPAEMLRNRNIVFMNIKNGTIMWIAGYRAFINLIIV